jgi:hypothetical protein
MPEITMKEMTEWLPEKFPIGMGDETIYDRRIITAILAALEPKSLTVANSNLLAFHLQACKLPPEFAWMIIEIVQAHLQSLSLSLGNLELCYLRTKQAALEPVTEEEKIRMLRLIRYPEETDYKYYGYSTGWTKEQEENFAKDVKAYQKIRNLILGKEPPK